LTYKQILSFGEKGVEMAGTALVTGASSGIGEETATRLLRAGYTVYSGARRVERMKPLEAAGAHLLALDVTDDASMVAAVETILREAGRIDVLVNNAGYGSYGALEDVPLNEARRQFDVNVFGLARLTQLVLPAMRKQRSGRIVNVSSIGGKIGEPFGSWYHATKFAVEGLSDSLRMEVRQFGIDVIVIQPGAIISEWNNIAREGLIKYSGRGGYGASVNAYAKFMEKADGGPLPSPPGVVAKTIVAAVAARKPRTRYATGGGARMVLLTRKLLSDRLFDALMLMGARPPKRPS